MKLLTVVVRKCTWEILDAKERGEFISLIGKRGHRLIIEETQHFIGFREEIGDDTLDAKRQIRQASRSSKKQRRTGDSR